MNTLPIDGFDYLGVRFSTQGMASVYGARVDLFIPRHEIMDIRVKYGVPGERAWFELAFGIILLAWAALQIMSLIYWLTNGGTRYTSNFLIPLLLFGVGGWLVWDSMRKAWYFEVQTTQKTRKLAFFKTITQKDLGVVVETARLLGYQIDDGLLRSK